MEDKVPVTEARAQLSELINRVGFGKERIILTRHGKPLVALVPAEVLDDLNDRDRDAPTPPTVLDISARAAEHGPAPLSIAAHDPHRPEAR